MGNKNKKKSERHHHHHEESSDSKNPKRKKSKSSKKKRKAKEPYKLDLGDDFEKDEMMDISKSLHPISYYITDREEMVNQMFMSLDWKHVRSMLPPGLKSATEARVKELALREILGISNERILSILNGQQLDSSSDSDVENDVMISPKTFSACTSDYNAANESGLADDRSQSKLCEKSKRVTGACQKLGVQESEHSSDDDTLEIGITPKEMGELLEDPPIVTEDKPVRYYVTRSLRVESGPLRA